jgi:hypothetical protein
LKKECRKLTFKEYCTKKFIFLRAFPRKEGTKQDPLPKNRTQVPTAKGKTERRYRPANKRREGEKTARQENEKTRTRDTREKAKGKARVSRQTREKAE